MTLRLSLLAAAAALLVVACKPPEPKDKPAEDPSATDAKPTDSAPSATGPIARVNGKEIDRALFSQQMERTRSRFERAGRGTRHVRHMRGS